MIIGELNERVSSENHIKVTGNGAKFEVIKKNNNNNIFVIAFTNFEL